MTTPTEMLMFDWLVAVVDVGFTYSNHDEHSSNVPQVKFPSVLLTVALLNISLN